MELDNPKFVDPVLKLADEIAAKIQLIFDANTAKQCYSAEELQAALPEHATDLTDGMISTIAARKGWTCKHLL